GDAAVQVGGHPGFVVLVLLGALGGRRLLAVAAAPADDGAQVDDAEEQGGQDQGPGAPAVPGRRGCGGLGHRFLPKRQGAGASHYFRGRGWAGETGIWAARRGPGPVSGTGGVWPWPSVRAAPGAWSGPRAGRWCPAPRKRGPCRRG